MSQEECSGFLWNNKSCYTTEALRMGGPDLNVAFAYIDTTFNVCMLVSIQFDLKI